jgi:agmatinase
MDQEKLAALRAKFGNAKAFDIFDERLKKIAESLLGQEVDAHGRRKLPFSGASTFLGAPHQEQFEGLDLALVGVPMDLGVTNRTGARLGPRAIRAIERIGPYNHQLGLTPKRCRVYLSASVDRQPGECGRNKPVTFFGGTTGGPS